jgi:hypothetical protein
MMAFLFIKETKMASETIHMPKLVRAANAKSGERSTLKLPGLDSAEIYLGGFVPGITGAAATLDGIEFGVPAFADDNRILGFVSGFTRQGGNVPLQDDDMKAGTVTEPTGDLPLKYAFSATNDESNTTSAKLEQAVITPIFPGDILEVSLWGASTSPVPRGTTTAAGTTDSSDNMGVGLSVDTTYHFALTESSADKDLENKDFMTILVDGRKPTNPNRVYVICLRSAFGTIAND